MNIAKTPEDKAFWRARAIHKGAELEAEEVKAEPKPKGGRFGKRRN